MSAGAMPQDAAAQQAQQLAAPEIVDPTPTIMRAIDTLAKSATGKASTDAEGAYRLGQAAEAFTRAFTALHPPQQGQGQ